MNLLYSFPFRQAATCFIYVMYFILSLFFGYFLVRSCSMTDIKSFFWLSGRRTFVGEHYAPFLPPFFSALDPDPIERYTFQFRLNPDSRRSLYTSEVFVQILVRARLNCSVADQKLINLDLDHT